MKQRVLVVDDSAFVRRMISDWIVQDDDLELAGIAKNGGEAVEACKRLKPDVITLDVHMPEMDGVTALEKIMAECPTSVIMVSTETTEGAKQTIRCLDLGALDFVSKPQGSTSMKLVEAKQELLSKVRDARFARMIRSRTPVEPKQAVRSKTDKVVVIASSTGGPRALVTLFESLPKGFSAPVLIVQHMPAGFTESFAKRLDQIGTVPCKQASEGDRLTPGLALLAPGGRHMQINDKGAIELNDDPSVHGVRPAADKLFVTAAKQYGKRIVGLVLTGMGRDGAAGAKAVADSGGVVYGEAESTCTIYGMPKAAKAQG
ncbi:MAG: protein-glutamate methylesterase/protein-glutamine glutaminase, partial [Fimbriimonadaceae bacterium]